MIVSKKQDVNFWGTALILFLFWILITIRLNWQHLIIGALCSTGVALFNRDLILQKKERPLLLAKTIGKWLNYCGALLIGIIKSNLEVAMIVLRPKMNLSPCFVKFNTRLEKPLNKVILGNSITLTPGTLTVEVRDDCFIVHALTRDNAEDVVAWNMIDKLLQIEEAEKGA